jgi:hypothetical protein
MVRGGRLLRVVEPNACGDAWRLGPIWAWTGRADHGSGAGAGTRRGGAVAVVVDQLGGPPPPIPGW